MMAEQGYSDEIYDMYPYTSNNQYSNQLTNQLVPLTQINNQSKERAKVYVEDEELWKKFEGSMEMIILKKGRKMFPLLSYQVKNLEADSYYTFELAMEKVENKRYQFKNGGWIEGKEDLIDYRNKKVRHLQGFKKGKEWMTIGVSFRNIMLTNNAFTDIPCCFVLQSMSKYRPVLTMIQLQNGIFNEDEAIKTDYQFDFLQFYAVTVYKNKAITDHKIEHNKYAKGFKTTRDRKRATQNMKKEEMKDGTTEDENGSNENNGEEKDDLENLIPNETTFEQYNNIYNEYSAAFSAYPPPYPTLYPPFQPFSYYNNLIGFSLDNNVSLSSCTSDPSDSLNTTP